MKNTNVNSLHANKGLQTATNFDANTFAKYISGNEWTLEIAFPIQKSQHHGGLLDTFGDDNSYDKYHPKYANDNSTIPLYWWIDFSRAEHPRHYILPSKNNLDYLNIATFCPLNCFKSLNKYSPSKDNPNESQCMSLQDQFPTLLGTNPVYGCYFEWVYQALGWRNNYMHRPMEWAILEFSNSSKNCRNIEFVGRHAVKLIFLAQVQYKLQMGTYSTKLSILSHPRYCLDDQDCKDLRVVMERTDVFTNLYIKVVKNALVLTKECTSRPCFQAQIRVSVPISSDNKKRHVYVVTINENMRITVKHSNRLSARKNDFRKKICF